jgi:SAM-dependent methyltransferase
MSPTYTKVPKTISALKGVFGLYGRHKDRIARDLPSLVAETRDAMAKMTEMYGAELRGLKVLEVGPGPFLTHSYVLGQHNDVTAMDIEVIPLGFAPLEYLKMLRKDGAVRTAKTVARKGLGIDREYRRQLSVVLGGALPKVRVIQGNAMKSGLASSSFSVIYCRALFQHVASPEEAVRELTRLMTPGGILYISLHLYTSFNGSLDPRVAYGVGDESLHWAHLRPKLRESVQSESTLNRLPLAAWLEIFTRCCPGFTRVIHDSTRPGIREVAERLLSSGEIEGYTKEELCAHTLDIYWKKPVN